jgi:hypothetical protein
MVGPPGALAHMNQDSSWKILGCSKHPHPQKLLVYCTAEDFHSSDCQNIFHKGAENTIITLPSGCGSSLFARVASFQSTSKSLPTSELQILGATKAKKVKVFELEVKYYVIFFK